VKAPGVSLIWRMWAGILALLSLPPYTGARSPAQGQSTIVINEIAWSGTAASYADEWIELHNPSPQPIDLSG
jgi:hypothetical protein